MSVQRKTSPEKSRRILSQRAKILSTEESIKRLRVRLAAQKGELKTMRVQK